MPVILSTRRAARELAALWDDDYPPEFFTLAENHMDGGRQDVLDAAIALVRARKGAEPADAMWRTLTTIAEVHLGDGAEEGVELFAVAMAAGPGPAPVPSQVAAGLEGSGMFPRGVTIRMASGWLRPEAVSGLDQCATRRLLDLVRDDRLGGFAPVRQAPYVVGMSVMLGVSRITDLDPDDELGRSVIHDSGEDMDDDIGTWRAGMLKGGGISVAVRPCVLSLLAYEIETHAAELAGSPRKRDRASIPATVH